MILMCIDNKHQIYENGEHNKLTIGKEYYVRYLHTNELTEPGFRYFIKTYGDIWYCSDEIGILPKYFFETLEEKRLRKTFGLRLII